MGQSLLCKIVEVSGETENGKHKITVTTALSAINDQLWGELTSSWLAETNTIPWEGVSDLSLGSLVTAKVSQVTDFGVIIDIGGIRGLITSTNLGNNSVSEGDDITGVVSWIDRGLQVVELVCDAELINRVLASKASVKDIEVNMKVKAKVVLSKTEHHIAVVALTHPRNVSGLVGYLGTRQNLNDLAGLETETGKELSVSIYEITSNSDIILAPERELRKAQKSKKRRRENSENANSSKDPEKVAEIDCNPVDQLSQIETSVTEKKTSNANEIDGPIVSVCKEDLPKSKKKKAKKSESEGIINEDLSESKKKEQSESENFDSKSKIPEVESEIVDPGWDFSATRVTLPGWQGKHLV